MFYSTVSAGTLGLAASSFLVSGGASDSCFVPKIPLNQDFFSVFSAVAAGDAAGAGIVLAAKGLGLGVEGGAVLAPAKAGFRPSSSLYSRRSCSQRGQKSLLSEVISEQFGHRTTQTLEQPWQ